MPVKVTPFALRIGAMLTNLLAIEILTIHVIFVHDRTSPTQKDSQHAVQRVMLITSAVIFAISFALQLWAQIMERKHHELRLQRLENHLQLPTFKSPNLASRMEVEVLNRVKDE